MSVLAGGCEQAGAAAATGTNGTTAADGRAAAAAKGGWHAGATAAAAKVVPLTGLLVQKYLLYWYKGTDSDASCSSAMTRMTLKTADTRRAPQVC